jgi:hypothetical protein
MRHRFLTVTVLVSTVCAAQQPALAPAPVAPVEAAQTEATHSTTAPTRTEFHVRYVNGSNVYIDGGKNAGLAEGTKLVLKQNPTKPDKDESNAPIEPGVVAKLTVVSVASASAVCEIVASSRELVQDDVVSLPDAEVEKMVEKNTIGNTRKYPMVVTFSEGDPLDEEVRNAIPRPPLPEVNQARGRIGFDLSRIDELGQGGTSSTEYGMIFRGDFTRIAGTHWNLNGYWRGNLQSSSGSTQQTLQDAYNRTYLMSATYINPASRITAGVGRLFLPWAASLETIDGGYVGMQFTPNTVTGIFAGSTPDPTSWSYNPNGKIGGAFFNLHGGNFENFRYSTTGGVGVNLLGWAVQRPFVFTENNFSYKRFFSLYESLQLDKPTPNPNTPPVGIGLGQSLLSLRVQVHPRVSLDLTDTYFRDVPTYDPILVGTGLLDKYLFQGLNGGARIQFPMHITGYFSLGNSSDSSDPKTSLNTLFGATMSNIWKTGLMADVRFSKFDSAFASGSYRSYSLTRDLGERLRVNVQFGNYDYTSSLAANSNSRFINAMFDTNLGARYFVQTMFTTQRGGTENYNQWTSTLGYRFDNRASAKRRAAEHANQ